MSRKVVTLSFSTPIELSILMEEHLEDKKIHRSELIKNALWEYLRPKHNNNDKIDKIFDTVEEIKNLITRETYSSR